MNENGTLERTEELGEKHFLLPFVYNKSHMDRRGIGFGAPRWVPTNRANHNTDESDSQSDYVNCVSSNSKNLPSFEFSFKSVIEFSQMVELFTF